MGGGVGFRFVFFRIVTFFLKTAPPPSPNPLPWDARLRMKMMNLSWRFSLSRRKIVLVLITPPQKKFFFKFLYNFLNKHSSARRWMQMRLEHSGNVPMQSLSLERASLLNPLRSRIILKLDLSILEQLSCVDPDPCQCEVEQLFPLQWAYLFTFWTPSSMPVWLLSS